MVALCVWILDLPATDLLDLVDDGRILQRGTTKIEPVGQLAPGDDVIDRGQREAAMVQVPVFHGPIMP